MGPFATTLIFTYLITAMIFVGLSATAGEILATLRDRRRMARALLANVVLVPALGIVLVRTLSLSADTTVGVLLLAFAPGGAHAIQFTDKVKGEVPYAASLLFVLSLAALMFTPPAARLLLPPEVAVSLPYLQAIGFGLACLALPMLIGFGIRQKAASVAAKLLKPLNILSTLSFIAAILMTMSVKKQAMRDIGGSGVAAMLILLLGSMVIGWFLGGPTKGQRQVSASATGIRNAPLCLLLAVTCFRERGVDAAVLAFTALMIPPNLLFTIYHAAKSKREQPPNATKT